MPPNHAITQHGETSGTRTYPQILLKRQNDQAHVVGYERPGYHELVAPLNKLMREWSLWKNLFCTTMEQLSSTRGGSKQKRKHVKEVRTPAQRLLATTQLAPQERLRCPLIMRQSARRVWVKPPDARGTRPPRRRLKGRDKTAHRLQARSPVAGTSSRTFGPAPNGLAYPALRTGLSLISKSSMRRWESEVSQNSPRLLHRNRQTRPWVFTPKPALARGMVP
jgi:hypothetical protein